MSGVSLGVGETWTWSTAGFVKMIAVGPTGAPGANGTNGTFIQSTRGAWSSVTTYVAGDIVTNAGSSWLALLGSTNVTPVVGTTWALVAQGATGSVASVNSVAPVSGNVTLTAANVGAVATTAVGAASGVASLDGGGKVPVTQLPNAIMEYQGTWNATTNTPTLADGTGHTGDVYRVSVGGTRNLGSGSITFAVSDYCIYNGTTWEKADTTDAVASVNGFTGAVVLAASDVGALATAGTAAAATKLATARTINGVSFDGTANITAPDATKVPTTTTVNGHALSSNVTVTTADLGAATNTLGGSEKVAALSATTGTATGDCSAASWFTITPTGAFTLAFSNVPAAGTACTVTVEITQGGTPFSPTLPTGGVWLGTAPTQVASKTCLLTGATRNGGTTWFFTGAVQA